MNMAYIEKNNYLMLARIAQNKLNECSSSIDLLKTEMNSLLNTYFDPKYNCLHNMSGINKLESLIKDLGIDHQNIKNNPSGSSKRSREETEYSVTNAMGQEPKRQKI